MRTRQSPSTHRIETLGLPVDPVGVAGQFMDAGYLSLLDSALMMPGLSRHSYVAADPFIVVRSRGRMVEIIRQGRVERRIDNPFDVLKRILAGYRTERREDGPPFQGGALGYFGYEMARHLERLPTAADADLTLPDMSVGLYDWVVAFDHAESTVNLVTTEFSPRRPLGLGSQSLGRASSASAQPPRTHARLSRGTSGRTSLAVNTSRQSIE